MSTDGSSTGKTVGELTRAELIALLRDAAAESLAEIVDYPDDE